MCAALVIARWSQSVDISGDATGYAFYTIEYELFLETGHISGKIKI